MNDAELIELLKPCEALCKGCGSKCCYSKKSGEACKNLNDGKCISRNIFCLLVYCRKMEMLHPEITDKLKEEIKQRFKPTFCWENMQ